MKPHRGTAPLIGSGLLIGLLATPAFATDPPPTTMPAATAISTSLPVFGVGITLDVTTDASGHLTEVAVTGADPSGRAPGGIAATGAGAHQVKLVNTETGTEVQIGTDTHKIRTTTSTSELGALVGDHTWTDDLFGTGPVEVRFSIGDAGGEPTIDVTGVSGGLPYTTRTRAESGDGEVEVEVEIVGPGGRIARVKIEVDNGHSDTETELEISARSELLLDGEHDRDPEHPTLDGPVDEDHDHEDHDDEDHDRQDDEDHEDHDDEDHDRQDDDDSHHDDHDRDDHDDDDD